MKRKGQMGGGRAVVRQESDGEEAIEGGEEGGGKLSTILSLNERKRREEVGQLILFEQTCLCLSF